jgi:hypothetical protein
MTCDDKPGRLTVMPGVYDDVQMFFLGLKNILQSLTASNASSSLNSTFPIDVFLEHTDGVCSCNLNGEYVMGIITVYEAVEFEDWMI